MNFWGVIRERIPVMWFLGSEPAETNAREAVRKVEYGYRTTGLKLGVYDPKHTSKESARCAGQSAGI